MSAIPPPSVQSRDVDPGPLCFLGGRIELQPGERRLLIDGRPAEMGARAMDLLIALATRPDHLLTKNELLDQVWPGLVVEEANLHMQVSNLRKLLGKEAIATVPGRGYRFTLVRENGEDVAPNEHANPPVAAPERVVRTERRSQIPAGLTALHGRAADIERVRAVIAGHPVVTIVAASGVGKTRLAQAVAREMRDAFPDGVWWIDLQSLHEGEMVATAVAQALGFQLASGRPALEMIVDVLRTRSLLLVPDNCEHLLVPVAALVNSILQEAPGVHVLATSIEPLRIDAEHLFRLDTLEVPALPGFEEAKAAGAVQLFVERVNAVDRRFVLTEANVELVVAICRRLDGIPLALELAAARVPLLGLEGLHRRLDDRLRLLGGGARTSLQRHQTLRAALDFTHGLLTPEEQACFRRVGVFAGSFSLEHAQEVAADAIIDSWAVLDHLGALVDKSIVLVDTSEPPRLRLLETARLYALEKLETAGETAATKCRHARAMATLLIDEHHAQFQGNDAPRAARLSVEIDNIRVAIAWSLEHDPALALEICSRVGYLLILLELQPEGARYCEAALAGITPETPPLVHGRLLVPLAILLAWSKPARSMQIAARAVKLLRDGDDMCALHYALLFAIPRAGPLDAEQLGYYAEIERRFDPAAPPVVRAIRYSAAGRVKRIEGRFAEARRSYEEGAALLAMYGSTTFELTLGWLAGECALLAGDYAEAVRALREQVRRRYALPFKGVYLAMAIGTLATAELCNGETAAARATLADAAPWIVRYEIGVRYAATAALLAAEEGRWRAAAQLLGYADAEAKQATTGFSEPAESLARERALQRLTANASSDQIAAWQVEGAGLDAAAAYRLALA